MFFENKEDYLQMKNIKNHYHYIEVDLTNIAAEYQVMLVCDRMDSDQENRSLELFNSVYPIIMLRESGNGKIVGILKPEDTETFSFNDAHNLRYRKYIPTLSGYEREMFNEICQGTFHYYPYLSDSTVIIASDNSIVDATQGENN